MKHKIKPKIPKCKHRVRKKKKQTLKFIQNKAHPASQSPVGLANGRSFFIMDKARSERTQSLMG